MNKKIEQSTNELSLADIVTSLEYGHLNICLHVLRYSVLKLSESNIDKPMFNIWKRAGILDSFISTEKDVKTWNRFSVLDLILLKIVEILWNKKFTNDSIKKVIAKLLNGDILEKALDNIAYGANSKIIDLSKDKAKADLLSYLLAQSKNDLYIPKLTNIEGLIIGSIKIDNPFSIIIFEDGEIDLLSEISELDGTRLNTYFKKTFTNIAVRDLIKNVTGGKKDSLINKENNLIQKLINVGYDYKTLIQIFDKNDKTPFVEEPLDIHINIEKILREKSNQNLIIKIRNGEKRSIRRIVFN